MTTTDTQIVDELKADTTTGFESLYQAYSERLFGYAVTLVKDRDLAADVTHNALLRAVGNVGSLRDPQRLRPWLFSITRNEALSALRVQNKWSDNEEAIDMLSVTPDFDRSLQAQDAQQLVHQALDGLSPKDRDVLSLALRNDLDATEVAAALGTSTNQARASISRAKAALTAAVTAVLLTRQQAECPALQEAIKGLDGFLTPLMRKRVSRHVKECPSCEEQGERRALSYVSGFALPVAVALPVGFAAKAQASVAELAASGTFPGLGPVDEAGFPIAEPDAAGPWIDAPTEANPVIEEYELTTSSGTAQTSQVAEGAKTWQKAAVLGVGAVVAGGILFLAVRSGAQAPPVVPGSTTTAATTAGASPSGSADSRSPSASPTTTPSGSATSSSVSPTSSPTGTTSTPTSATPTTATSSTATPTSATPTPTRTLQPTRTTEPTVGSTTGATDKPTTQPSATSPRPTLRPTLTVTTAPSRVSTTGPTTQGPIVK